MKWLQSSLTTIVSCGAIFCFVVLSECQMIDAIHIKYIYVVRLERRCEIAWGEQNSAEQSYFLFAPFIYGLSSLSLKFSPQVFFLIWNRNQIISLYITLRAKWQRRCGQIELIVSFSDGHLLHRAHIEFVSCQSVEKHSWDV